MKSFADLKKNKTNNALAAIEGISKQREKYVDETEWKLTVDNNEVGSATVRFLDDEVPVVQVHSHYFGSNDNWFIETCPTTAKGKCPVCEEFFALRDQYGKDQAQKMFKDESRKSRYWANIYVVKDKAAPENEGKVFKYGFPKKIFDKIIAKARPDAEAMEAGVESVDVFDFDTGSNFLIKTNKVGDWRSYDDSQFLNPSPWSINGDTDPVALTALYETRQDLSAMVDPKNFKSYDDLKAKFDKVRSNSGPVKFDDDIAGGEVQETSPVISEVTASDVDVDELFNDI
jgi:hypothetical protein